jgi:hypothetical protein
MMKKLLLLSLLLLSSIATAQVERPHEQLISVTLQNGIKQEGVLSRASSSSHPTHLAVLLPGSPSVVRPVVEGKALASSKLNGNFLIRARRHLVSQQLATLIVDCRSDSGDTCSSAYQASLARHQDVFQLILQVKKDFPSIQKIWLVGTSMGTISSSFMPTYDSSIYAGAIHTASINETYIRHAYVEMRDFDYKRAKLPQVFIHHQDDPCIGTTYSSAKSISEKFQIPLITVQGGGDFRGEACKAFTQHGFRGKEREVMLAIQKIILTGQVTELVIQ